MWLSMSVGHHHACDVRMQLVKDMATSTMVGVVGFVLCTALRIMLMLKGHYFPIGDLLAGLNLLLLLQIMAPLHLGSCQLMSLDTIYGRLMESSVVCVALGDLERDAGLRYVNKRISEVDQMDDMLMNVPRNEGSMPTSSAWIEVHHPFPTHSPKPGFLYCRPILI